MRCGRISVEGEAEEIAVSPRPRSRQRHAKGSTLYSTRGLDQFENVYAELSARREYIVNKTGAPEALVKFSYWKDGWVPVVVRAREGIWKKNDGGDTAGVSILEPAENSNGEKDRELGRKDELDDVDGESQSISISVFDERSHSPVMPWSQFLKNTAFGGLALSAMWVRKSAVPAAAVMAVGGGICMKKFFLKGVSYLAGYSRNPKTIQIGGDDEAIAEQKDVSKITGRTSSPGLTISLPSRPVRGHVEFSAITPSPRAVKPKTIDSEHNHHHRHSKAKKVRRVVALDNRPTRPALEVQGSYRRTRQAMAYDTSMSSTVFIITLFCLVFSGRLCAIFFTSAWWYLLPVLRKYERNH
jgi:hypothetical protein